MMYSLVMPHVEDPVDRHGARCGDRGPNRRTCSRRYDHPAPLHRAIVAESEEQVVDIYWFRTKP